MDAKFKIGDTVFVYMKPTYVNRPESCPVWECKVISIESVITQEKGRKDKVKRKYGLEKGWDRFTEEECNIFPNKNDAYAHARESIQTLINKREETQDKFKAALSTLNISD